MNYVSALNLHQIWWRLDYIYFNRISSLTVGRWLQFFEKLQQGEIALWLIKPHYFLGFAEVSPLMKRVIEQKYRVKKHKSNNEATETFHYHS